MKPYISCSPVGLRAVAATDINQHVVEFFILSQKLWLLPFHRSDIPCPKSQLLQLRVRPQRFLVAEAIAHFIIHLTPLAPPTVHGKGDPRVTSLGMMLANVPHLKAWLQRWGPSDFCSGEGPLDPIFLIIIGVFGLHLD